MRIAAVFCLCLFFAGAPLCPGQELEKIAGIRHVTRDVHNRPVPARRQGNLIWNNAAVHCWWSDPDTSYLNLDWGILTDQGNTLPGEVIDGFTFVYGTNSTDPAGEQFAVTFFDQTTGWGNKGIARAEFSFAGLPNAATYGTLPPGYGWIIATTIDLEGSGYEFLLGEKIGFGLTRESEPSSPTEATGIAIGRRGLKYGNGYTGTEDMFDTYYPNGVYENSWCAGGGYPTSPWATFSAELFGGADPGTSMTYGGLGATGNDMSLYGNDMSLYTVGDWVTGSRVRFLMDKNGSLLPAWLLASSQYAMHYVPGLDLTVLVKPPLLGTMAMKGGGLTNSAASPDSTASCAVDVGPAIAGMRIYFQGAVRGLGQIYPADMSNGVYSN
jgi:hypothetical protein